jgi:hypothetical protein
VLFTSLIGYLVGVAVAALAGGFMSEGRLLILMPPGVVAVLGAVTALMCVLASLTSVARVVGLEPAIVFKA